MESVIAPCSPHEINGLNSYRESIGRDNPAEKEPDFIVIAYARDDEQYPPFKERNQERMADKNIVDCLLNKGL